MIKSVAFLLLVGIIVMLLTACYFFERTTDITRLARPQKKNLNDKKINEFLLAKHHEPIHPNLFWLLFIPACLFASPALAQGSVSHSSAFSHPGIIILFILIMLTGMVKRPISIQSPTNEKKVNNKKTAALSPCALFLFRLFAIALAALIITASVNA